MQDTLALIAFLTAVIVAAATGVGYKPGAWYAALAKPSWTPPGWLFGPVWLVMYTVVAVAGWLVWKVDGPGAALALWSIGLVFNAAWSWIMFKQRQIGWALVDMIAMWISVALFIAVAWPVSPTAASLFIPYLAWVSFALALNATIWRMNPNT